MVKIKITERVTKEVELPEIFKTQFKGVVTSYYRSVGKFVVSIKLWASDNTFSMVTVEDQYFNDDVRNYEPVQLEEWQEIVDKAKAYLDTVRI